MTCLRDERKLKQQEAATKQAYPLLPFNYDNQTSWLAVACDATACAAVVFVLGLGVYVFDVFCGKGRLCPVFGWFFCG